MSLLCSEECGDAADNVLGGEHIKERKDCLVFVQVTYAASQKIGDADAYSARKQEDNTYQRNGFPNLFHHASLLFRSCGTFFAGAAEKLQDEAYGRPDREPDND